MEDQLTALDATFLELEEAALPAEPVRGPVVLELEVGCARIDIHPADGILLDRHVDNSICRYSPGVYGHGSIST